jgi:hypothetical protein
MKNRILGGIIVAMITVLVDLGLFSVFLDSAFHGHYPEIQVISFLMVFLAPIVMIGFYLTNSVKAAAWFGT